VLFYMGYKIGIATGVVRFEAWYVAWSRRVIELISGVKVKVANEGESH